jgi:hypothetical protein
MLFPLQVGNNQNGGSTDVGGTMLQKFWDSALALEPEDDDDTHRSVLKEDLSTNAFQWIYDPSSFMDDMMVIDLKNQMES